AIPPSAARRGLDSRAVPTLAAGSRRRVDSRAMAEEAGQIIVDEELDAQTEARRRLALAQIRQWGDPVLRMRAGEVADFDDDLKRLTTRMTAIMRDAHGVGLAGNQVGVIRRVFVFETEEHHIRAVVNPAIVDKSKETEVSDEGCLSLQGVLVPVERS